MRNKKFLTIVSECLNRSLAEVQRRCPTGAVKEGISAKDIYHQNKKKSISLYTAAELLWALSLCKSGQPIDTIINELVQQIDLEYDDNLHNNMTHDRTLEEAFLILSLSNTSLSSKSLNYLVDSLRNKQKSDGSWGTFSKAENGSLRATALSCLAFSFYIKNKKFDGNLKSQIKNGLNWLLLKYSDEFLWGEHSNNMSQKDWISTGQIGFDLNSFIVYTFLVCINTFGTLIINDANHVKEIIYNAVKVLGKVNLNRVVDITELEIEEYKIGNKYYKHDHGAGHLEFYILMIMEHYKCKMMKPIYKHYANLKSLLNILMKNEQDGRWKDKNTNGSDKMWTLSYGIYTLSAYIKFNAEMKWNNWKYFKRNFATSIYKLLSIFKRKWILGVAILAAGVLLTLMILKYIPNWVGGIGLFLAVVSPILPLIFTPKEK